MENSPRSSPAIGRHKGCAWRRGGQLLLYEADGRVPILCVSLSMDVLKHQLVTHMWSRVVRLQNIEGNRKRFSEAARRSALIAALGEPPSEAVCGQPETKGRPRRRLSRPPKSCGADSHAEAVAVFGGYQGQQQRQQTHTHAHTIFNFAQNRHALASGARLDSKRTLAGRRHRRSRSLSFPYLHLRLPFALLSRRQFCGGRACHRGHHRGAAKSPDRARRTSPRRQLCCAAAAAAAAAAARSPHGHDEGTRGRCTAAQGADDSNCRRLHASS